MNRTRDRFSQRNCQQESLHVDGALRELHEASLGKVVNNLSGHLSSPVKPPYSNPYKITLALTEALSDLDL